MSRPLAAVRFRARGVFIFVRNFSRGIFLWELLSKVAAAAAAATLDSNSQRKIPREKFRTKINTPRARKRTAARGRDTSTTYG